MTNEDAAKNLRMVADFIESDEGKTTKCQAFITLTTPKPPANNWEAVFAGNSANVSKLNISTIPEKAGQ